MFGLEKEKGTLFVYLDDFAKLLPKIPQTAQRERYRTNSANSDVPEVRPPLKLRELISVGTDTCLVLSSVHPVATSNNIAIDSLKKESINDIKLSFDTTLFLSTHINDYSLSESNPCCSLYISQTFAKLDQSPNG